MICLRIQCRSAMHLTVSLFLPAARTDSHAEALTRGAGPSPEPKESRIRASWDGLEAWVMFHLLSLGPPLSPLLSFHCSLVTNRTDHPCGLLYRSIVNNISLLQESDHPKSLVLISFKSEHLEDEACFITKHSIPLTWNSKLTLD